ncbi:uncharacterized protein SRS1_15687 [Sporisorium reilianum f. sp. reilianum]|uniref:Uncharacterized protein n=1 Tax=Sporisorium reilianum f. sp. reilianum TaxID=72559 RepID=A0A2N8UKF8_9BASI|nr:uncharacterized protein SRS1_15687 [Sporisorium reilianum f. sp. reilianum]
MSDRYHGSAYRSRGGGYRDERRYPPRHHPRDEHDYADSRAPYDTRDSYGASSYYPEQRGYADRPHGRRVHKAIPPPRPWDYSRRPPPRTEQERIELEREREAWEAKEEERYKQRMEEERERQREWDRRGYGGAYGPPGGRDREADAYDRERAARYANLGPSRRPRSRSPPGPDPRFEQRGSWGRTSVGSSEGRDRELAGVPASASTERLDAPSSYPPRRSSPPPASSSVAVPAEAQPESSDGAPTSRYRPSSPPHGTPRDPARDGSGFISTPPTGPRASRGGPPAHPSSAFRGREGSGSAGPYTPGSDRDCEGSSYMSPSNGRFGRGAREGGAYRGGHPSFGRGRRDTGPYEHYPADEEAYRGGYAGAGSSPHENSPYSPSTATPGTHHLSAPRLSRTSSSQTSAPAGIPTGPSSAVPSPSTLAPPPNTTPHFSSAHALTPDLDAELLALETQRSAFIANYVLGGKRSSVRTLRTELRDAELEFGTAGSRRLAAERALEVARETADAYSLEENRKEELQRLIAQQLVQHV